MIASKANILALQETMLALPQLDLPIANFLIPGVYVRSMFIPKGTCLVGKIHNHQSISIVAAGDISLMSEDGLSRVQPPFTAISQAGIKRVGYAHEDTVFITVHQTNETELGAIESELVSETFEEFEKRLEKL